MSPVRRRDLAVVAVGLALASWLVVRSAYGDLPPLRWWLPVPLGVLALAEALGARTLRARLAAQREARRGARTLDVDVVLVTYDDGAPVVSDDPALTLPHPRAHERAFVLVPWVSVDPAAVLPGRGPVADLLAALPAEEIGAVVRWEGRP